MIIAYAPLLVAVIGLLVYVLSTNPKAAEAGRIMFLAGMIATCLALSGHTTRLL